MRVWVTRDEEPGGPLSAALHAAGLTAVLEPVMERRVVDDAEEAISQLGPDDWLVLTSVYAVEAVAPEPSRVPRVAVVSEASRAAAEAKGFRAELVSAGGDGKSLFQELRDKATWGKVCYPRSSLAKAPDPWPGIELLSPVLYETVAREFDRSVIDRVDAVSVASPSAVDAIGAPSASAGCSTTPEAPGRGDSDTPRPTAAGSAVPTTPARGLPFASIGPTTSAALRRVGIEPWVEAPKRSFESLAQAIASQSSESRHQRA